MSYEHNVSEPTTPQKLDAIDKKERGSLARFRQKIADHNANIKRAPNLSKPEYEQHVLALETLDRVASTGGRKRRKTKKAKKANKDAKIKKRPTRTRTKTKTKQPSKSRSTSKTKSKMKMKMKTKRRVTYRRGGVQPPPRATQQASNVNSDSDDSFDPSDDEYETTTSGMLINELLAAFDERHANLFIMLFVNAMGSIVTVRSINQEGEIRFRQVADMILSGVEFMMSDDYQDTFVADIVDRIRNINTQVFIHVKDQLEEEGMHNLAYRYDTQFLQRITQIVSGQ